MSSEETYSTTPIRKLLGMVLIRFIPAVIILGAVLFIAAGTLEFWNAWLYIGLMLVLMTTALIYLITKDPTLLEKRMRLREREPEQKKYVRISIVFFILTFLVPGLDYRYQWSAVPLWLVILSAMLMTCGYVMFFVTMMQNRYASRVIEIQENQKVIDTGLYSVVRHPMYLAASILYLFSPIVLGSFYGIIPMLLLPFVLAYRIRNEENVLIKGLNGYKEYTQKVKYRLIPHVW